MLPRQPPDGDAGDGWPPTPAGEVVPVHAGPAPNREQSADSRAPELPRIAGYSVERRIGSGGSATVYLGRELKHDRAVALKVLHPALAASLQAERFLREIEIIAGLAHPNILPLLDSGRSVDLLYYATPYVAGQSLRTLVERHVEVKVEDALRIVVEVAEALDYAHRQGVVHRDIKPENILLADGHALVADFGIARAVKVAADERLTSPGLMPGTLMYMSPEQSRGDPNVDGRSDVYSLGCVLFELLTGAPPFHGGGAERIVGGLTPAESVRALGAGFPPGVELALARALAKRPNDRFPTAAAFAAAIRSSAEPWPARGAISRALVRPLRAGRRRWAAAAAAVTVIAALAAQAGAPAAVSDRLRRWAWLAGVPDTLVYVVVPTDSGARAAADLVRGGMMRWRELTVEDEARMSEALSRLRNGSAPERAERAALSLGAGRYVLVRSIGRGDSVDVVAALHDTRTGRRLVRRELRVPGDPAHASTVIVGLGDSLLFRDGVPHLRLQPRAETSSLWAQRAYFRGHAALIQGRFGVADSAFFEATRHDPTYAQALVWLAHVRSWMNATDRTWRHLTSQAAAQRHKLAAIDSLLLDALSAWGGGGEREACGGWTEWTERTPFDFAAWYGLGNCLRRDLAVVRDARSPSGWRFRSSYHQAVNAYERAFRLQPSVLGGFGGRSLADLQAILFTSSARVRTGRAIAPDTQQFSGYPAWHGDTLAFVPLLKEDIRFGPAPDAIGEAIQQQRSRLRDMATMWRAEFPRNAEAAEAVAIAMELLGDESAVDTLAHARRIAVDPDDRLRMAAAEVWSRVKFSSPGNRLGLRTARRLADSLLRRHAPNTSGDARLLGSLAALTGRAHLTASYARAQTNTVLSPAIAGIGPALIAYSAMGGPADSLHALEQDVMRVADSFSPSERVPVLRDFIARAASLAFPEYSSGSVLGTDETGIPLGNLVAALLVHDTTRAMGILTEVASSRRWLRPADIMTDGLLPEASALAHLGRDSTAIERLDRTLRSLRLTASQDLAYPTRAGPLVRAMVLRARLAHKSGDRETARQWALAVVELWSGADGFLQPIVQQMRSFAN